jgi:putative transposase
MARKPREIVPDCPHHVTQRGNYRQQVFCEDADYALYMHLLQDLSSHYRVAILAYCLMPNHVHLIATPPDDTSLPAFLRQLQGEYSRIMHKRSNRTGHLWQSRYFSEPLIEEVHLWNAVLYVERNPSRAKLTEDAAAWMWSSARSHLGPAPAADWLDVSLFRERFTIPQWQCALACGHADAVLLERIHDCALTA